MKCEICGRELTKGFWLHVKSHGLTKTEYQEKFKKENNKTESMLQKAVSQEGVDEKIVKDNLKEILDKYNITIDQMIDALDKSFGKKREKSAQDEILENIEKSLQDGFREADRIKGPDYITTNKLLVAEALVKHFNYKVDKVSSNPKTWHLVKNGKEE